MTDFFRIELTEDQLREVSSLGLAYVGDCVYELLVRSHLLLGGHHTNRSLHAAAVELSRAGAQAGAAARLLPALSVEELAVYRRGRNSHVHSVPKSADVEQYHAATGLECLFGWLYLRGDRARVNELFRIIVED